MEEAGPLSPPRHPDVKLPHSTGGNVFGADGAQDDGRRSLRLRHWCSPLKRSQSWRSNFYCEDDIHIIIIIILLLLFTFTRRKFKKCTELFPVYICIYINVYNALLYLFISLIVSLRLWSSVCSSGGSVDVSYRPLSRGLWVRLARKACWLT